MRYLVLLIALLICGEAFAQKTDSPPVERKPDPLPSGKKTDHPAATDKDLIETAIKTGLAKEQARKAAFADLNKQLQTCLKPEQLQLIKTKDVKLVLKYSSDGNLIYSGILMPNDADEKYQMASLVAIEAARRCQPVQFAPKNYLFLQQFIFGFE